MATQETSPIDLGAMTRRSSWRSITITLVIMVVLLVLAFRGVSWGEMMVAAQEARVEYIALAFVVLTFAHMLRSVRWQGLLRAERPVSLATSFWATVVGYLGNSFLPARAGEVIRTVLLSTNTGISKSFVFATALAERILDVPALVLMSLLSLSSLSSIPSWLMTSVQVMALLGGVGALGLFVAPRLEKHLLRAIGWLPMRSSWQMRAQSMLQQFLLGMRSLQNPGRATQFVVLTVAIWLVDAGVAMVVAQALGLHLSLPQALLLLAALGLSSAAPSTPGYVGIYQFVAVTVLMPFDFSRNQALVYIIMFQLVTYLVVSIWGGLGLWLLSRSKAGQQRAWVGHGRSH